MFIGIRRYVISLYFLLLSRASYAIFLLLIPSLLTSPSLVPLARYLFDGARPSFDRSGHRPRRGLLQPIPLHPPPLLLLLLRGGVTLEAIMAQLECMDAHLDTLTTKLYGFDTSIPQFAMRIQGTRIVVTPNIVSEILHVPRVSHPDYPGCPHLRTVSKDELLSLFCETLSSWGDRQNTLCSGFAKGPRFLTMVMTFNLHPLFHYNSITEPHARFFAFPHWGPYYRLPFSLYSLSHGCL